MLFIKGENIISVEDVMQIRAYESAGYAEYIPSAEPTPEEKPKKKGGKNGAGKTK